MNALAGQEARRRIALEMEGEPLGAGVQEIQGATGVLSVFDDDPKFTVELDRPGGGFSPQMWLGSGGTISDDKDQRKPGRNGCSNTHAASPVSRFHPILLRAAPRGTRRPKLATSYLRASASSMRR